MKRKVSYAAVLVVALGLLAAGCGSQSGGASSSTNAAATQSPQDWLTAAQKDAQAAAVKPTQIQASGLGSVTPAKGKTLYFIGCDQSIPGCVAQVKGFRDASTAAGYKAVVCDAKFDIAAFQNCMSQAVQAKPAAIVNNARPQSDAPEAYASAHAAHIPVIGQFTAETPKPDTGNAAEVGYVCQREGQILGNHIVAATSGKANVAVFADTVYRCNQQRAAGVKAALQQCPTCKVDVKTYSAGTAQTDLPPLLQSAVQSNPNLNWIVGTPGFAGTMAADAVRQAGKKGSISVGTFDGDQPELALMRKKDIVTADVVSGVYENGWAVVDVVNRLLAGKTVPSNIENSTQMLFTPDNVPAQGTYEGPVSYQTQFKKLWGVG